MPARLLTVHFYFLVYDYQTVQHFKSYSYIWRFKHLIKVPFSGKQTSFLSADLGPWSSDLSFKSLNKRRMELA